MKNSEKLLEFWRKKPEIKGEFVTAVNINENAIMGVDFGRSHPIGVALTPTDKNGMVRVQFHGMIGGWGTTANFTAQKDMKAGDIVLLQDVLVDEE